MDKNDFDIDFDFEKEYGFDPEDADLSGDFDMSEFSDLDIDYDEAPEMDAAFDLEDMSEDAGLEVSETADFVDNSFDDEDFAADTRFPRHAVEEEAEECGIPYGEEQAEFGGEFAAEEIADGEEKPQISEKKKLSVKLPKLPKLPKREKSDAPRKPTIFTKIFDLYVGPITNRSTQEQESTYVDANGRTRRRRKPSKMQILKEVYLPPIIACVALVLILTFIFGSITNAFKVKKMNDDKAKKDAQIAQENENRAETEYAALMAEAERLAMSYDYEAAAKKLEEYTGDSAQYQQEIIAKKAEYVNTQSRLVEWKDPNAIANLSFHVLIHDPQRAFIDPEYKGLYNKNFVTTSEFSKILNQLYSAGYVLVDFDSFVASNTGLDGNKSFFIDPILLPEGKKPIMITETLVNYFEYMVDGNKDGEADAGGDGFASRLVVNGSGDIKAQYVDASGQTQIGDYDLVPILESFIKEHPEFSYRGARAILAVTGTEGVFGYRTNTSYIANKGQDFYDKEVADAKMVVNALREKGYTLASYTYNNEDYRNLSVNQIKTDMQNWAAQVTPILGEVDVMVFARNSDIDDYSGNKFSVLYDAGFRFFVGKANAPKTDVNATFVRQSRLMVTGNSMGWTSSMFTGYFDCNAVLDMTSRGNIPN